MDTHTHTQPALFLPVWGWSLCRTGPSVTLPDNVTRLTKAFNYSPCVCSVTEDRKAECWSASRAHVWPAGKNQSASFLPLSLGLYGDNIWRHFPLICCSPPSDERESSNAFFCLLSWLLMCLISCMFEMVTLRTWMLQYEGHSVKRGLFYFYCERKSRNCLSFFHCRNKLPQSLK